MKLGIKLSLAPLFYARVHAADNGPIQTLEARKSVRLGEEVFEAFATLKPDLLGSYEQESNLYGRFHGTGTSVNRAEAIYKAISEALERWAWLGSQENRNLGLDLDNSTTGFAAFPGLGKKCPRSIAYHEAVERWCLSAWWEKKIGHNFLEANSSAWSAGIALKSPVPRSVCVILWKDFTAFRAYGFAAAATVEGAQEKAKVELGRNIHVLEHHKKVGGEPGTRNEERLLFFASEEGKLRFNQRLGEKGSSVSAPDLVIDCPVPGQWSQYTHVWRCLLDPKDLYDPGEKDYFHF